MIARWTLLITLMVPCFVCEADDWPCFRGPRYDGISSETIVPADWPDSGPVVVWRRSIGWGLSGMSASDGRLYTMGNEENVDTVFCLDAGSGETLWSHSYPSATDPNEFDGGPTSTPTVDIASGAVYSLSRSGELFCLDASSGEVRWRQNVSQTANVRIPAWGFAGSPYVHADLLLLNAGDAAVAVQKATGELAWASPDKDAGYSSMVPMKTDDRDAVVFGSARSYVCVDANDGTELWRQRWLTTFGCNAADPIVFDDQVFLSSGYNRGAALLRPAGDEPEVVWKSKEMQNQLSTSVRIGGHVYGIHGDVDSGASLRCLSLDDGSVQWSSEGVPFSALSATRQHLIALTDDGDLVLASATPERFQVIARHAVLSGKSWVAPVVSGGRIYCRSGDGELVCVRAR